MEMGDWQYNLAERLFVSGSTDIMSNILNEMQQTFGQRHKEPCKI